LQTTVGPPTAVRDRAKTPGFDAADVWRQRLGALTAVPSLIGELGADPDAALAAAGLSAADFAHPEHTVPFGRLAALMREAAERTATPHFGLLAGRAWRSGDLGVLGERVRHSATVREALSALVAYQHLNSQSGLAFLWERAGFADLGYAIYQGGTVGGEQLHDAALALATNLMREMCGAAWQPSEVLLSHAAPPDARHYRNLFRVVPRFDSEYCALRFPAALLDTAVIGADRERSRRAAELIAAAPPLGLPQAVYRTLRILLLKGECSGDNVARSLGLHRRTLNRRLREAGTTFQRCLDQVRFEVACQLLSSSHVHLDDIAATLGYASVSPFMRTFRRWSGTTPAAWRRSTGAHPAPVASHGGIATDVVARGMIGRTPSML